MLAIVDLLVLHGCQVVAGAVESALVVPVDPTEGGKFDGVDVLPRALAMDQLGFEQADFRLGQRIIERVADRPNRWRSS